MKKFILLLSVFLSCMAFPTEVSAKTTQLKNTGVEKPGTNRPRIPHKNNVVTASFDGRIVLIDFIQEEGMAYIILISDSGTRIDSTGDTANTISITCEDNASPYHITILTDHGNVYEGTIN